MDDSFLKRLLRKDPTDPLDAQMPTPEECFKAISAPHDADVHVLKYLSKNPEYVEYLGAFPTAQQQPKPLMEYINEVLEDRIARGEKGGELLQ